MPLKHSPCMRLLTGLLLAASVGPAAAGQVSPARPAEYMIYQYPDTSLIIRAEVSQTAFRMETSGPDSALLASSGLPGNRIAPLYQFIKAPEHARQLMVRVIPERPVDRADIAIELVQFAYGDQNRDRQLQAYRLLARGMERSLESGSAVWAMKIYSLRQASREFMAMGMEEMSLWSDYNAAHLALYGLNDPLTAIEQAATIDRRARRAGFPRLRLAALSLEGEARSVVVSRSDKHQAGDSYGEAHTVLQQAAALAEEQGLAIEQSRALFLDGGVFERQGETRQALERYRQALRVAAPAGDEELANLIRSTAAAAYESLGKTAGAIAMLEDISGPAKEDANARVELELAANLQDKGRLLNDSFRFREAATTLSRALELQKRRAGVETWGPTALELVRSLHEAGYADRARNLAAETLGLIPLRGNEDRVAAAYGRLAAIYRAQGQYDAMARYRKRQGEQVSGALSKAAYLFELAMDEQARGGGVERAVAGLERARKQARTAGDKLLEQRAALQVCLVTLEAGSQTCPDDMVERLYAALSLGGAPRIALEAAGVRVRILLLQGLPHAARSASEQLLDDIGWYRTVLPGVLGAWYQENGGTIFAQHLETVLADGGDGSQVMLALDYARRLAGAVEPAATAGRDSAAAAGELRELLARRRSARGSEALVLTRQIDAAIRDLRRVSAHVPQAMSAQELDRLIEGLAASEAVLVYAFIGEKLDAVLASTTGVRLIRMAHAGTIRRDISRLHAAFGAGDTAAIHPLLERLGQALLEPLGAQLPQRLYLLPAGPLKGLPFDTLRLRGHFLAESHEVVNLRALDSLRSRQAAMRPPRLEQVFLAGSPQARNDPFSYEVSMNAETAAVRDRFIGPGLHIVQGVALSRDEFRDSAFSSADLLHLGIPARSDLAYPERSRMLLGGSGDEQRRDYLAPDDLRALTIQAQLAVLSGLAVASQAVWDVDGRLGLVTDLLDAGAGSVVTTLLPPPDAVVAEFAQDFYAALGQSGDVAGALAMARRTRIRSGEMVNFRAWAGFQLHIR